MSGTSVEDDRRKEAGMTEEGKDDSDVKIQYAIATKCDQERAVL